MPEKRFKAFTYDELVKRSSAISLSLDIFWLKDDGLEDSASLPDPDMLAGEFDEFALIPADLRVK